MQSPPSSTPYGGYIPNSPYIPVLFEYKLYRAKSLSKIWYFSPAANYIPSNTSSIFKSRLRDHKGPLEYTNEVKTMLLLKL